MFVARLLELALRALLFLIVGGLGVLIGSYVGVLIGGLLEVVTDQPVGEVGATVYAYSWGGAMLGSLLGGALAVVGLGWLMRTRA